MAGTDTTGAAHALAPALHDDDQTMTRLSWKFLIALAVCLLNQGQGSAQDTGPLAPVMISDQISTADSLDSADFLQRDNDVELAAWLQQPALTAPQPDAPTVRRTTRGS